MNPISSTTLVLGEFNANGTASVRGVAQIDGPLKQRGRNTISQAAAKAMQTSVPAKPKL